jgi:hypothetical protein
MHVFDYHPVTKYEEMPETVQKDKSRGHWDAEPQIVGGKTKYPLYSPPEVAPVRDAKPFESTQTQA